MNTLCPTACASTFSLTSIKPAGCDLVERKDCVRSIGFYKCDTALPNPLTSVNIEPLMTGATPELVFSNPLSEVVFADPVVATRQIADCMPQNEFIVSREMTFKDKISVDVDAAAAPAPFLDYDFWKNKTTNSTRLNVVIAFCSGRLVVPREPGTNIGMASAFSMHINYEKADQICYEFKQGKVNFLGDPIAFDKGDINLNTVTAVSGLW